MKTTKRTYETLYIVDYNLTDEQIEAITTKFSSIIVEQGGEVQAAGKWDKRRLTYEIKGRREGTFILMYFSGEASVPKELDRVFRISDDIIRHIILRVEPQHVDTTRIERPQPAPEPVQEVIAEAPAEVETVVVETEATTPQEGTEEVAAEEPATEA